MVALAIVVAVVVVVAVLDLTGTYPFGSQSSPGPGPDPTFDGAVAEAQPAANSLAGGPWQASYGAAVRLSSLLEIEPGSFTGILSDFGCNVSVLPSAPTELVVQPTPASAGSGASGFWLVGFQNASGEGLGVVVDDGVSTPIYSVTPAECPKVSTSLLPFPTGSPDSSAVIGTVNAAGGSAFLAAHPNATVLMAGFGGIAYIFSAPSWFVTYNSCPVAIVANESGFEFNASVQGTALASHTSGPVSCVSLSDLKIPFAARAPTGSPALGKAI